MSELTNNVGDDNLMSTRGRPIKFTPERIEQIKNLVERGMGVNEIAATIGTTPGSLTVTASKHKLSLRRPRGEMRTLGSLMPRKRIMANGNDSAANLSILLEHKGKQYSFRINLDSETVIQLSLEASVRDKRMDDFITEILHSVVNKDYIDKLFPTYKDR